MDRTIGDGVVDSDFDVDVPHDFEHEETVIHDHRLGAHRARSPGRHPSGPQNAAGVRHSGEYGRGPYVTPSGFYHQVQFANTSDDLDQIDEVSQDGESVRLLLMGVLIVVITVGIFAFMFRDNEPVALEGNPILPVPLKGDRQSPSKVQVNRQQRDLPSTRSLPTPRLSSQGGSGTTRNLKGLSNDTKTESAILSSPIETRKLPKNKKSSEPARSGPKLTKPSRAKFNSSTQRRKTSRRRVRQRPHRKSSTTKSSTRTKFTDNDFKAFRFRFNTLKSNEEKRLLVKRVLNKRRLKPGDKYYLEVKSLLDSL